MKNQLLNEILYQAKMYKEEYIGAEMFKETVDEIINVHFEEILTRVTNK